MFVGLLKCADCGYNMRTNVDKNARKDGTVLETVNFICGNYGRSGKTACSAHHIREAVLTELVLETVREHAATVALDREAVMRQVLSARNSENASLLTAWRRELKASEDRLRQLGGIIQTLYEDRLQGVVTEVMFKTLMTRYEQEREDKTHTVLTLRDRVERSERQWQDIDAWAEIIGKYAELAELTPSILLELIDRVEVGEATKELGRRVCHVRIVYRFIGDVADTLIQGEQYERAV